MKILVLGGGLSPERQVSLRSAKNIANAARAAGFEVQEADPADGFSILDGLKDTVVFPILHGKNGEDGVIQKELEDRKLPYLGSSSQASAECFDKWQSRTLMQEAGIPMPKAYLVNEKTYRTQALASLPHVLKIVHGGSSIGVLIVRDPSKVAEHEINEIFAMEEQAVLEELIGGTEITIPILGNKALPVIEIRPPTNAEFDYENKYNGATAELCPAESVSAELQAQARVLAEKVHQATNCRHLSRVDMMLDKSGQLYVLETNIMPGLTEQSLYPKAAAVAGYDMPKLIKQFVDLVKQDFKN